MASDTETEVKIRLTRAERRARSAARDGFPRILCRVCSKPTLSTTRQISGFAEQTMLLRLRQVGDKSVLTWKGRGVTGPHKSRAEIETHIGSTRCSGANLSPAWLSNPSFRYEKYRDRIYPARGTVAGRGYAG